MKPRSVRQSFLGEHSDAFLRDVRVAIVGVSGGGSPIAQQLAHVGFGNVMLIDPKITEEKHRHRLIGITSAAVKREWRKVRVVERLMKRVNPEGNVKAYPCVWQEVHEQLRECALVFSCQDGYQPRDELERYVRRFKVPMIDIGMDVRIVENGYQICGQVITSQPGGPCMRCLGFITDERLRSEAGMYGVAGGAAQVVWPNGTLASTAVGIAMQLLLRWNRASSVSPYLVYDGNTMELKPSPRLRYLPGHPCPHFDRDETHEVY